MKKKAIGKAIRYSLGGFLLLLLLATGLLYSFKDKIIQLFVAEANRHLKTKVQVEEISLSLIRQFPNVAIALDKVTVTESLPGSTAPLAKAKHLYFTLNLPDLLAGQYRVREVLLEEGQVFVKFLPDGTGNYLVFASDDSQTKNKKFSFQLEKVTFKNVAINYSDERREQFYQVQARQVAAALQVTNQKVGITATGKFHVQTIQVEKDDYFQNKEINLQTKLLVDRVANQVNISPSEVRVGPARYQVTGSVNYDGLTDLDLNFTGKNTNIQALLALLPPKFSQAFGEYQSQGNVYFNGTVKGITSGKANPKVLFQFGCRNATFFHSASKQKLEDLNFQGQFSNGSQQNNLTSVVELKNIRGRLRNRPFTGNVVYRNLQDPYLQVKLKGNLDVAHALEVFPNTSLKRGSGEVAVDIAFAGKVRSFQSRTGYGQVNSSGEISLRNVLLQVKNYKPVFRQLNGNFLFRKSDLAVTNFKGKLGSSDFLINGFFKNVLGWLFLSNQRLHMEADLESDFLNFDELLSEEKESTGIIRQVNNRPQKAAPAYKLIVSPYFDFDVNTSVQHLQFRRFRGKNVRGKLRLKNQIISSPELALQIIGGRFAIRGLLDARRSNNIQVTTFTTVNDIRLDSLFYVFENFGQQFLVQRHLRGELTATIHSDLYFNSHLKPLTDRMEAEVNARIHNGQLLNFEPMQKLSPFIPKRELAHLQFSDLSNTFWIQNRTVYIPEMEVRSNVSRASVIGIQGMHTFDQQLDYKFRVPLRNKMRRAGSEVTGLAENNGPNLFLTLKGNENNYKVAYDKQRVKAKITQDLRREKQEFEEVIKNKPQVPAKKQTSPQPNTEEYFDF
ncbi:MAG: AsmA-like C-terminal region-containing protein [Bacteroidota bacterium]|nr:AsmA-like C-terminal region-containing protein [Bacteroidota bacterium]